MSASMEPNTASRRSRRIVALIVAAAVLVGIWRWTDAGPSPRSESPSDASIATGPLPPAPVRRPEPLSPQQHAEIRARATLSLAQQLIQWDKTHLPAVAGAAETRIQGIERMIAERARLGAPGFAADLLGWRSNWQVMKSAVSSEAGAAHRASILTSFEQNILRGEEFEAAIRQAIAAYITEVEAAENAFLVKLIVDLKSIPDASSAIPALESPEQFRQRLAPLYAAALRSHTHALTQAAVQDVVVAAVSTQVAEVIVRRVIGALSVRSGMMAAGTAAGTWTLGISLVAAILLDAALDQAMAWAGWDAQTRVTNAVTAALEQISHDVLQGREEAKAEYRAMQRMASSGRTRDAQALAREAIVRIEASGQLGLRRDLDHMAAVRFHALRHALEDLINRPEQ